MLNIYISIVTNNPLLSAAVHFAILGTLGEVISASLMNKKLSLSCAPTQMIVKIFAWAALGVFIKYGFAGMKGFTHALIEHHYFPEVFASGIAGAFLISVLTNLFFGPQMMFVHRLSDNLILGKKDYVGLNKAWWTLLWFWIPAHTITFALPLEYQIGLAALWGMVLGMIMGFTKK